jgi:hypothetical protein
MIMEWKGWNGMGLNVRKFKLRFSFIAAERATVCPVLGHVCCFVRVPADPGPLALTVVFASSWGEELRELAETAVQTMHKCDALSPIHYAFALREQILGFYFSPFTPYVFLMLK